MPLICAKSLTIQRHYRKGDGSEKLDRRPQFETGLTGTPYAVDCRTQVIGKINKNWKFQAGVKPICLQIAICNRACEEGEYSNNNILS